MFRFSFFRSISRECSRALGFILSRLRDQERSTEPAPVDAVVGDLGSAEVHDLGEVDLVTAVGVRAGVLPHQGVAVEVIAAGAMPAHEVVGAVVGAALEERPDLLGRSGHRCAGP
jgi:hypothetical protein